MIAKTLMKQACCVVMHIQVCSLPLNTCSDCVHAIADTLMMQACGLIKVNTKTLLNGMAGMYPQTVADQN